MFLATWAVRECLTLREMADKVEIAARKMAHFKVMPPPANFLLANRACGGCKARREKISGEPSWFTSAAYDADPG